MRIEEPDAAARRPERPGRTRRGRPVPTSKDVARVAGVSQSTVSYVLSGKRPISEATRQLVLDAIDQLTYEPNAGARALAGHRTNVIGMAVPFHAPESARGVMAFTEEIATGARRIDHDVLLLTAAEGPSGLERIHRRALCDAAIVMEVTIDDPRAAVARELGMPMIFVGFPDDPRGLHCIDFDFETAADLLVDELADARPGEIAVLGWDAHRERMGLNYVHRFRGRAEARARDRGTAMRWIMAPGGRAGVEGFLDTVLGPEAGDPPAVLVTHGVEDVAASLLQRGLIPGRDLDLVALCSDSEAQRLPVPTTSVDSRPRDVSREAMEWLAVLLEKDMPPEVRRVGAEIVRRGSVRAPR